MDDALVEAEPSISTKERSGAGIDEPKPPGRRAHEPTPTGWYTVTTTPIWPWRPRKRGAIDYSPARELDQAGLALRDRRPGWLRRWQARCRCRGCPSRCASAGHPVLSARVRPAQAGGRQRGKRVAYPPWVPLCGGHRGEPVDCAKLPAVLGAGGGRDDPIPAWRKTGEERGWAGPSASWVTRSRLVRVWARRGWVEAPAGILPEQGWGAGVGSLGSRPAGPPWRLPGAGQG